MEMVAHDVYIKHIDKSGAGRVECHRCWDSDKFIRQTELAARKEGGRIEHCSEAEYRKSKNYKEPK